ncbi:hypothetical protein JNJ66_01345 [Candidatus Saccharibacteria bacterium]|nr:hypothetical protein [Candidatus Saccharibacteria bacterium]
MKKGQRGFSAVEGVLIAASVMAVGVIGWSFYNNSAFKPVAGQAAEPGPRSQAKERTVPGPVAEPEPTVKHKHKETGIAFTYPKDWKVAEPAVDNGAVVYRFQVSRQVTAETAKQDETNIGRYKHNLLLDFELLSSGFYDGFAKDNQFAPDDNKQLLGDIIVAGKRLKLVAYMADEKISSVNVVECRSDDLCDLYVSFGRGKYALISIGSLVGQQAPDVTIDPDSKEYKALLQVAESIKL